MRYRIDRAVILNQSKIGTDLCTYSHDYGEAHDTCLPQDSYISYYTIFNARSLGIILCIILVFDCLAIQSNLTVSIVMKLIKTKKFVMCQA